MNCLPIAPICLAALSALAAPVLAGGPIDTVTEAPTIATDARAAADPWSGVWGSLTLGTGRSTYDISASATTPIPGLGLALDLPDFGGKGGVAGVELGYNHRIGERLGLGVEIGYSRSRIDTDASLNLGIPPASFDFDYRYRVSSTASVLGRLGYLVNDNTMLFALAGMSRAQFDGTYSSSIGFNGSYGIALNGMTLGAGIETMMSDKLSIRLDYRVTQFEDVNLIDAVIPPVGIKADLETNVQTVNTAVVLRF